MVVSVLHVDPRDLSQAPRLGGKYCSFLVESSHGPQNLMALKGDIKFLS